MASSSLSEHLDCSAHAYTGIYLVAECDLVTGYICLFAFLPLRFVILCSVAKV